MNTDNYAISMISKSSRGCCCCCCCFCISDVDGVSNEEVRLLQAINRKENGAYNTDCCSVVTVEGHQLRRRTPNIRLKSFSVDAPESPAASQLERASGARKSRSYGHPDLCSEQQTITSSVFCFSLYLSYGCVGLQELYSLQCIELINSETNKFGNL